MASTSTSSSCSYAVDRTHAAWLDAFDVGRHHLDVRLLNRVVEVGRHHQPLAGRSVRRAEPLAEFGIAHGLEVLQTHSLDHGHARGIGVDHRARESAEGLREIVVNLREQRVARAERLPLRVGVGRVLLAAAPIARFVGTASSARPGPRARP